MITYAELWDRAVDRKGEQALRDRFPTPKTAGELRALGDDRYLAAMTQHVFAAGFRWTVIETKWDGFEAAFHGFDPGVVAAMGDQEQVRLKADRRIVRNAANIAATIENAAYVVAQAREHGSFAAWIADWPAADVVGLWDRLKGGGSRLGGMTGARFLRAVGKDTFMLTTDVVTCLRAQGLVSKGTSKRDHQAAQAAFNTWTKESGECMGAVSIVCAATVDSAGH